jgi:hypothetical protein
MLNQFVTRVAFSKYSIGRLAHRWLARPFSQLAIRRILLIYHSDPLAQTQFYPFIRGGNWVVAGTEFRTLSYADVVAGAHLPTDDVMFVQSDYVPAAGILESALGRLKAANPSAPLSYFDWFAPTDIRLAGRVEPWSDFYVKKSLLRDFSAYLKPTEGHTNLTDYYAKNYRTHNPAPSWHVPAEILPKLVAGPAFSTARELIGTFERSPPVFESSRPIDLHARIATKGSEWYSLMRTQAAEAVARLAGLKIVSQGRVSKRQFMNELHQSKLAFSPFGYGEICWRDFEAIAAGAVLIKPDMSHVLACPDIYRAGETYISIRWDFADLEEKIEDAIKNPVALQAMARRAFEVVHKHLQDGALGVLIDKLSLESVKS